MNAFRVFAFTLCVGIVAATLQPGSLLAEKKTNATPDFKDLTDEQFTKLASAAGMAEVNLSQLALQRATRAEVKEFAQHMIDDHSKANTQLLGVINAKKLQAAERMDAKHQA